MGQGDRVVTLLTPFAPVRYLSLCQLAEVLPKFESAKRMEKGSLGTSRSIPVVGFGHLYFGLAKVFQI
jgi:hypothetical protein